MNQINNLPSEIIYYISEYLPLRDRYNFAKTNTKFYRNIWSSIDISYLFDLMIYSSEINFYSTLFSDNIMDWMNHSYIFDLPRDVENGHPSKYSLGYYYQEPNLYLRIYKVFADEIYGRVDLENNISREQIKKIREIEKLEFILDQSIIVEDDDNEIIQIDFSKKIGYISESYDLLLDKIHKNIQMILVFFQAQPFFPVYMNSDTSNNTYDDILYEDLCKLSLTKNKNYFKEDICRTYYFNVWYDGSYHYKDWENLKLANENKQKILSQKIHNILQTLRLTDNQDPKDRSTFRKMASYMISNGKRNKVF